MEFQTTTQVSDLKTFLRQELVHRCKRNPHYSLRSFAKAIDLDPSSLSKIMNGKRKPGLSVVKKIVKNLGLSEEVAHDFFHTAPNRIKVNDDDYTRLTKDCEEVAANWYHYAILELLETRNFKYDLTWISQVLNISQEETQQAIERLKRLKFIEERKGTLKEVSNGKTTTVGSEINPKALLKSQKDVLLKSLESLEKVPLNYRDHSAMTVAISKDMIPEAKEMIKKFRRKLSRFLSKAQTKDEVYNIAISLYPLSNTHQEDSQ